MTPKEKAQQLVAFFEYEDNLGIAENTGIEGIDKNKAIKCALIAVDEILNVASPDEFTCKFFSGDYYSDQDYFIVVKTEIEKL